MCNVTILWLVKMTNRTRADYVSVKLNSFKAVYTSMRLHVNFGTYSKWRCNRLHVEIRASDSFLWFTRCSRKGQTGTSDCSPPPHVTFTKLKATRAQTPCAAFTAWSPARFPTFDRVQPLNSCFVITDRVWSDMQCWGNFEPTEVSSESLLRI